MDYEEEIHLERMSSLMETEVLHINNFINGEFVKPRETFKCTSPTIKDDNIYSLVPDSNKDDVDAAVEAAKAAFPAWSSKTPRERAFYLKEIARHIEERKTDFATAESSDQGKTTWMAENVDIPKVVHNFRHFAETIPQITNTCKAIPESGALAYTSRESIGVAGLIIPYSFPMYLLCSKIAAAIMCGNTVVAKPSELTPHLAYFMCYVFKQADIPPGVVNIVFGTGTNVGMELVKHPDVEMISFTGSSSVGRQIATVAAPMFKKMSIETGGINSAVVFEDCDLDQTLSTLVRSCFLNLGQSCICTSRIYVHDLFYDKFIEKFVEILRKREYKSALCFDAFLGSFTADYHIARIRKIIAEAIEDGGTVLCGETKDELNPPPYIKGNCMAPTVIANLQENSRCMQEEIFGPLALVLKFSEDQGVIDKINNVKDKNCSIIFTKDSSRAHNMAEKLKVDTVWINSWWESDLNLPFGSKNNDGIGREETNKNWEFFTTQKNINIISKN